MHASNNLKTLMIEGFNKALKKECSSTNNSFSKQCPKISKKRKKAVR